MEHAQIRAVIFQDETLWIAQCLEYDICAQASTVEEAYYRLRLTIDAERNFSRSMKREAFDGIVQAPPHFFEKFESAGGSYTPSKASPGGDLSGTDREVELLLWMIAALLTVFAMWVAP